MASKSWQDNYLAISDLQLPFEHEKALKFCKYLQRHFKIPEHNILNVGDEVDQYWGSLYKKDPNALFTPSSEINITKDKLKQWAKAFPVKRVAISNHGMRWAKKAWEAEIPKQMIRGYQEVLGIPKAWQYKYSWVIRAEKRPFTMIHGMGYSGISGHRNAAIDKKMSCVIGHLHSHAGVAVVKNADQHEIWGMNTGCLIDETSFAFHYGRDMRYKPAIGCGVILNGGMTAMWIPLE